MPSREGPPWPMTGPAPCASHPDRETLVHCNSCGRPVCPDCMVYSPVGVKCKQCAKQPRSALVTLKGRKLVLTIAAAIGAGTVIGFAYYFVLGLVGFFFLAFFAAAAMGYVVAEAVLRASRYYRGKETAWIAVGGTVWAFFFPLAASAVAGLGVGWNAVVLTFAGRGIINWVVMLVACWIAYQRNR
jgi:MFS family permease